MSQPRPTLACATPKDLSQVRFPLYASRKLDGLRALVVNGQAVSRTLKPIRIRYVRSFLNNQNLNGLDGELIVGDPTSKSCFRDSTSGIMSEDGEPEFTFYAFDHWYMPGPFSSRIGQVAALIKQHANRVRVELHDHYLLTSLDQLLEMEADALAQGYEGLITRDPAAEYKYGRSSLREQGMLKIKQFVDAEARVVAVQELMHNGNEAKTDHLGYTERSSHQENMVGLNMLGALICRTLPDPETETDVEFAIGTGMTAADRTWMWNNRDQLLGKFVKFKHFPIGAKDKPRHPVFLGFRDPDDL